MKKQHVHKKREESFSNDFTLVYLLDINHSFPFFFACNIFIKLQTIITIFLNCDSHYINGASPTLCSLVNILSNK